MGVARKFGIGETTARRYYMQYHITGTITTSSTTRRWPTEFKIKAVQYMRENDLSSGEAGIKLGVTGHNTLHLWEKELMKKTPDPQISKPERKPKPVESEQKDPDELTRLKSENEYLRAEVAYLRMMEQLADEEADKKKGKRKPSEI